MKNSLLITPLLLLLFSVHLKAQIEKGNFMIGGNMDLRYNTNFSSGTLVGLFNPNVGYFVGRRLALGMNAVISGTLNRSFQSNSFAISPYARYYFGVREHAALFAQVSTGILATKTKYQDIHTSTLDPYIGLGIGHTYLINKHIGLETQLYTDNIFNHSQGTAIGFKVGLQIYVGKKKKE